MINIFTYFLQIKESIQAEKACTVRILSYRLILSHFQCLLKDVIVSIRSKHTFLITIQEGQKFILELSSLVTGS